ncbi:hypothetical protein BCR37DRAFT_390380 [Protomyces lactucae-debilis]|uniref:Uncharacterized protein n=1 Tax=Protomyces lactucae-debilis TaxID=2754530 RepID=A0A1Y2FX36_PROLT|nr:uncharacterized protein BCR37DRAFT_390380 [Protomyces lactucae-debilis]ORY87864.1 hypothetical protein BCR37DRAFT_390380 [Protomyces lactucae-debilis]
MQSVVFFLAAIGAAQIVPKKKPVEKIPNCRWGYFPADGTRYDLAAFESIIYYEFNVPAGPFDGVLNKTLVSSKEVTVNKKSQSNKIKHASELVYLFGPTPTSANTAPKDTLYAFDACKFATATKGRGLLFSKSDCPDGVEGFVKMITYWDEIPSGDLFAPHQVLASDFSDPKCPALFPKPKHN